MNAAASINISKIGRFICLKFGILKLFQCTGCMAQDVVRPALRLSLFYAQHLNVLFNGMSEILVHATFMASAPTLRDG